MPPVELRSRNNVKQKHRRAKQKFRDLERRFQDAVIDNKHERARELLNRCYRAYQQVYPQDQKSLREFFEHVFAVFILSCNSQEIAVDFEQYL